MKNSTKILIGLGVAGAIYATWRFVIKPKISEREANKQLKNYEQFENERELIAQALPQETETEIFENIS
jgi:hypothetical protein